jgi:hypothetical protein
MKRRRKLTFLRLLLAYLLGILTVIVPLFYRYTPPSAGTWAKYGGNPILSPMTDDTWEITNNSEPSMIYEDGLWKMWYTGGLVRCSVGYATSNDGLVWEKYENNPVLGQGRGSTANACHSSVFKHSGVYYAYFSAPDGAGKSIHRATSLDGLAWETTSQPVLGAGTWDVWNSNTFVWVEDGTWFMLYDSRVGDGVPWQMGLAKSADGIVWDKHPEPLTDLQMNGGTYGAPFVRKENGLYSLWYCATNFPGVLPTDIYHSTSTDLLHWSETMLVLQRSVYYESDQVCDPFIVTVDGHDHLYYAMGDNRYFVQMWIGTATLNTAPVS